ncbi:MAG: hypothetical protein OEU76_02635 [Cyclobacteriaceae bacterium]|nr:hypothetical protein [Cyclobacteriaceae bacterium]
MKAKTIISLTIAVIVTLSFTLISLHNAEQHVKSEVVQSSNTVSDNQPSGGFGSEDKL